MTTRQRWESLINLEKLATNHNCWRIEIYREEWGEGNLE